MKKRQLALSLLALLLVLCSSLHGSMAYFTTYVIVEGGYDVRFGTDISIIEQVTAWAKRLVVHITEDSEPVFVRAKAYSGSQYELAYEAPSQRWTAGDDGYYYYDTILYGGQSAEELIVHIGNVRDPARQDDEFHVVVCYETTPVLYQEDGTPYADWNMILYSGEEEGEWTQ